MSGWRLVATALFAVLASCGRDPSEQVLHVRLTMAGDARSGNAEPGNFGLAEVRSDTLRLSLDAPVRASLPGQPYQLTAILAHAPSFAGDARLADDALWRNVDASEHVRVEMAGHWPARAPGKAASGSMAAAVVAMPAGGLRIQIDAELLLLGGASTSRHAFMRSFEVEPASAWKDCALSATQARCTLSLRLVTTPSPPPPTEQVVNINGAGPVTWNREVRGMRVAWDPEGHFIARADGLADDVGADLLHDVHVVAWTSAPGDSREPAASAPRTPTIAR